MVSSIMVVDALTYCALLHLICNLKAVQMNMQHSLITELMLYGVEQSYNTAEVAKNSCCVKSEGAVDHSIEIKWLKKFRLGCKKFDKQMKLGRPITEDSMTSLEAIETNLASSTLRVSGKFDLSQSSGVCPLKTSAKAPRVAKLCLRLPKYCKTFDSPNTVDSFKKMFLSSTFKKKNQNVIYGSWFKKNIKCLPIQKL